MKEIVVIRSSNEGQAPTTDCFLTMVLVRGLTAAVSSTAAVSTTPGTGACFFVGVSSGEEAVGGGDEAVALLDVSTRGGSRAGAAAAAGGASVETGVAAVSAVLSGVALACASSAVLSFLAGDPNNASSARSLANRYTNNTCNQCNKSII